MTTDLDEMYERAGYELVICRYITRKGKRIYPKTANFFRFWVKKDHHAKRDDQ